MSSSSVKSYLLRAPYHRLRIASDVPIGGNTTSRHYAWRDIADDIPVWREFTVSRLEQRFSVQLAQHSPDDVVTASPPIFPVRAERDVEERGSCTMLLAVSRALEQHGLRNESGSLIKGLHADRVGLRLSNRADLRVTQREVTLVGEWKVSWKFSCTYRQEPDNSAK